MSANGFDPATVIPLTGSLSGAQISVQDVLPEGNDWTEARPFDFEEPHYIRADIGYNTGFESRVFCRVTAYDDAEGEIYGEAPIVSAPTVDFMGRRQFVIDGWASYNGQSMNQYQPAREYANDSVGSVVALGGGRAIAAFGFLNVNNQAVTDGSYTIRFYDCQIQPDDSVYEGYHFIDMTLIRELSGALSQPVQFWGNLDTNGDFQRSLPIPYLMLSRDLNGQIHCVFGISQDDASRRASGLVFMQRTSGSIYVNEHTYISDVDNPLSGQDMPNLPQRIYRIVFSHRGHVTFSGREARFVAIHDDDNPASYNAPVGVAQYHWRLTSPPRTPYPGVSMVNVTPMSGGRSSQSNVQMCVHQATILGDGSLVSEHVNSSSQDLRLMRDYISSGNSSQSSHAMIRSNFDGEDVWYDHKLYVDPQGIVRAWDDDRPISSASVEDGDAYLYDVEQQGFWKRLSEEFYSYDEVEGSPVVGAHVYRVAENILLVVVAAGGQWVENVYCHFVTDSFESLSTPEQVGGWTYGEFFPI